MPMLGRTGAALAGLVLVVGGCGQTAATPRSRAVAGPRPLGCPARRARVIARNPWRAARVQLAPPGASAMRLCRYAGLNAAAPGALARARLLTDTALIARLARELDALPRLPSGRINCPVDDGAQVVAMLAYRNGRRVTVALDSTGCRVATNGDQVRTANEAAGLVAELDHLTSP